MRPPLSSATAQRSAYRLSNALICPSNQAKSFGKVALLGPGHPPPSTKSHPALAPLGWEHISLTGDYVWADEAASARGAVQPLRVVKPSLLAA